MPTSYQSPMRGDKKSEAKTTSQSTETNTVKEVATVAKVLEVKGGSVYTIGPDDTIKTAVTLLKDRRIGALVVTTEDGALVGILSERDIVRKLAETPGQTLPQKVSDNMTHDVETCSPDDNLIEVSRRMTKGTFRHMPVMEDGKLCGMITIGDVVNYRLTELEHEALQLKQMIVG
ncbi:MULTISPECIES: CBS domain-containing protein [Halocynthiibacter]|uniref:CBS domain-containing protein n=1 Tax=Halocynthiibacter halioticoli TaxID=2986804 RepID=A0AAE3IYU8_9RHOB|nr:MULTISPECIES: CBS domain-containing protein [Halocynthiibacter]MCV6824827.1 CBS domain-containing protein [Halocynthiibacter halioticoli]MCW4057828.1 CBS domain-containing protein [Halocynthiibacter sp. SDUM655004]